MFARFYPEKLRTRIMLMAITLVCISTFAIAYIVEKEGLELLLQEKEQKLFAITHVLDVELEDALQKISPSLSREQKIQALNKQLSPKIEQLLSTSPKIGAGYYSQELDAIIVYAPQKKHGNNVGVSIAPDHPGREVMSSKHPNVWIGHQVRGNIMNAMMPIVRNDKVLGYIWANELVDDINTQAVALDNRILFVCFIGLICSIIFTFLLSRRLNNDIDVIKQGLNNLSFDLQTELPHLKGEMNEIVNGVNHLASALNEAKSINETILQSIIDCVITVDNNGCITMLNPAAEKITGYTLNEVKGKPYRTIIDDKNHESLLLDTLYHGNDHMGVEIDFPVSGKVLRISSSSSHLINHSGEIIGAVTVFKDLTEQQEIQKVMQQTERLVAIGELMAGVAHEIRNPLTAVRGFVQYLQKKEITEEKRNEYIAIILKEVDSINKVIQQLLDLSSPSKQHFTNTSLNQLIKDTMILLESSKTASNIDFKLELEENLPLISLDSNLIKQVLFNIVINALQSIKDKGVIIIKTKQIPYLNMQEIEVRDTGIGISKEVLPHLFTPFYTTKPTGTGLGLAIVQKIITAHNGTIEINNHPEGGVTVTIHLPMN